MCGAQAEMIPGFADQDTFESQIRIEARCTWPCGRCCVTPCGDRVFVEPYGRAAAIDESAVVFRPIPHAVAANAGGFAHDLIITIAVTSVNDATTSSYGTR